MFCLAICLCAMCVSGAQEGQMRVVELELEFY